MKETRLLMGMPITVEVIDKNVTTADIEAVYDYLTYVDKTFSTYKETSEISKINAGSHPQQDWSADMQHVMKACERTKAETNGFFDIQHGALLDPSGYVKGWAIQNAAALLSDRGFQNYYVDAGGDIQVSGHNADQKPWKIGIRNPFNRDEIVKQVQLTDRGMATSGTSIRGQHIYNPNLPEAPLEKIVSLTVISKDVVDADRFATAAFAMQEDGIGFIAAHTGFEGYAIDREGIATFTPGFINYVA